MNTPALRVLLVEDSASDAVLLQEALAEGGSGRLEVTHVDTWVAAGGRLAQEDFDVLLLDLSLPDSAGRETFLRARKAAPHLPIVVMTGIADEAVALDAMRHGIQDYLVKGQADGHQVARAIRYALERSRVEEALRETQAALKEANEELERRVADRTAELEEMVSNLEDFSHSVTHDLRAPLRAMRAFAQFLREECQTCLNPPAHDYAQRIITAAARMDKLIVDVLHYSRAARGELSLAPVNVSRLLRGIIESYPAFHSPQVEIRIEEPLPQVLGNEALLTQCFSNLLDNAVKFVAPGVAPRIRVRAEIREVQSLPVGKAPVNADQPSTSDFGLRTSDFPLVRLWFEDNGIGIPEEAHERIFQLFQRLDRSYEGTGVGLAIVRKGAEKMGGRAGVESAPGQGSRFWLDLKLPSPQTDNAR
jgi:signal transduction histidine kinase